MPDFLETTVDKFIFRVATDRRYTAEGLWARAEGGLVRVGLSDYVQQRSGDVAFATIQPVGMALARDQEIAEIETVKVTISLGAPVAGTVAAVNDLLDQAPETINADPYGDGWLALLTPAAWEAEQAHLLDPPAYFALMRGQAEEEAP